MRKEKWEKRKEEEISCKSKSLYGITRNEYYGERNKKERET